MKTVGQYKGFTIKEVDGRYIRDKLATEFSEWGSHLTYKFIPNKELWIEHQDNLDYDAKLPLIAGAYTEYQSLKTGKGGDAAYNDALKVQDSIRKCRKHLDLPIKLKKLVTFDKMTVWLVDGEVVRDNINSNFEEGGHGLVYKYVPRNEIWLDEAVEEDLLNILVHELTEYIHMLNGWSYDKAHHDANRVEHLARQSTSERNKIFKEHLKKLYDFYKKD